jgi:hypothetical protein
MKIAAVPDLHGSHHWEQVIPLVDDFDKIIVMGDEFDTWENDWPDQMNNALKLIDFKKKYPKKVELLWSNHAISYYLDEHCSGFQPHHAIDIKEFYIKNKNLYQVIAIHKKTIFAHGGVSKEWMDCAGIKSVKEINQLFLERPNFFRWVGPSGFGENRNEGPLWIRPKTLSRVNVDGYDQIVGHTEPPNPPYHFKCDNGQMLTVIDSPKHDYIYKIEI